MLTKFDTTNQKACLSLLEDITSNANQIQDSVLEAILSRNAHTEYLRGFLNGQVDKQSFKNNLPVVTYEDYRPYIDRIANGESSDLICDQPIIVLLVRYTFLNLKKNYADSEKILRLKEAIVWVLQLRYFRRSSEVDTYDSRGT